MKPRRKLLSWMLVMLAVMLVLVSACTPSTTEESASASSSESTASASTEESTQSEEASASSPEVAENDEASPTTSFSSDKPKIGFAQVFNTADWRIAQTQSIKDEAAARGYELAYTDAQEQVDKQISDVEDLINQGIEILIFDPVEKEGSLPCLELAKEAGIPAIVINRSISDSATLGEDYMAFIGADNVVEGVLCAEWIRDNIPGDELNIVEITGTPGSSAMVDRQNGFNSIVDGSSGQMKIIASQNGAFSRQTSQETMDNIIQAHSGEFNVVFAHNDEMALGAIQALKGANIVPGVDVFVVGINGQKEAVQAVVDGEMAASITCSPFYGPIVFDLIDKLVAGEPYEQVQVLEDYVIDSTNCEEELKTAF